MPLYYTWRGIVDDVRTIIQRQQGYIHIPNLTSTGSDLV